MSEARFSQRIAGDDVSRDRSCNGDEGQQRCNEALFLPAQRLNQPVKHVENGKEWTKDDQRLQRHGLPDFTLLIA